MLNKRVSSDYCIDLINGSRVADPNRPLHKFSHIIESIVLCDGFGCDLKNGRLYKNGEKIINCPEYLFYKKTDQLLYDERILYKLLL